jgi:hypothetical protein
LGAQDANKRYVATQIPEPPVARFFFADTRMAWFWLIVRLLVGSGWVAAGVSKVTGYAFGIGRGPRVTRRASRSDHEGAARCARSRRYAFVVAPNGVGAGACRFTIIETLATKNQISIAA